LKVVLDTNVFVSSFFGGNPKKVIDLWRDGRITLCLSGPILEEYVEVLGGMGLGGEGELDELIELFSKGFNLQFVARPPLVTIVKDDPDDDKFIGCAQSLGADFIVSGDKHLLRLAKIGSIRILTPATFLPLVAKGE